jgi:hypothetical protein
MGVLCTEYIEVNHLVVPDTENEEEVGETRPLFNHSP